MASKTLVIKNHDSLVYFNILHTILSDYMSDTDIKKVRAAYLMSAKAHAGQQRKSGEPYVTHPLTVATILAKLRLDNASICAAILHDCIEDTHISKSDISKQFGSEVANIVDGVTKLTGLSSHSNLEKQAENFRKLFLAMTNDVRVILIKLADRLHNIRTISAVSEKSKYYTAKETLEIHAPIAHRLGLNAIKIELENLAFATLYPFRYSVITNYIKKQAGNQKKFITNIQSAIERRLKDDNIKAQVSGRTKEAYSIFNKMRIDHLRIHDVFDVYAFRLIVSDIDSCYRALGSIHNLYKPLPGKFKDYIALPKTNGYQALHTILFGPQEISIEVQIRSEDMNFIAEHGIAAHWHYKEKKSYVKNSKQTSLTKKTAAQEPQYWFKAMLEIQEKTDTSVEFLEEIKKDLFPSEVFVFTPKGDIIQLPYRATIIDFAYAVHTEIGNHTVSAQVNRKLKPLSSVLKSGQTINVKTDKFIRPQTNWLKYVVTAKARTAIKTELQNNVKSKLISLGKHLLKSALSSQNMTLESINVQDWQKCLKFLACKDDESLFLKIGLGEILIPILLNRLISADYAKKPASIAIKHIRHTAISFAHCCHPIPDDAITGVMTKGKGLVIHRSHCSNLEHVKASHPQWLGLEWDRESDELFSALIRCDVENRRGVLASVANAISKLGVNIENVVIEEKDNAIKSLLITILIKNNTELRQIFLALKILKFIKFILRV